MFFGYIGGKLSRYPILKHFIPRGMKLLYSPFLGGGGLEFYLIRHGIYVKGNDKNNDLIKFYNILFSELFLDIKKKVISISLSGNYKRKMGMCWKNDKINDVDFAVSFWLFCLSQMLFVENFIIATNLINNKKEIWIYIAKWNNRQINFMRNRLLLTSVDFEDFTFDKGEGFIFLDPPYYIKSRGKIYLSRSEKKLFDFDRFFKWVKNLTMQWCLTFNYCKELHTWLKGYEYINLSLLYSNKFKRDTREMNTEVVIFNRLDDVTKIKLKGAIVKL